MNTNIRNDLPLTNPVFSRRRIAGRTVRLTYAILMLGFAAMLGWFFLQPLVYISGTGNVTAPKYVVSSPYLSRIEKVFVAPGQRVDDGAVVASITSPQAEEFQANMFSSLARVVEAEVEINIELAVATSSLDESAAREENLHESVAKMEQNPGAANARYRMDLLREHSESHITLERFRAQIAASEIQVKELAKQRTRMEEHLNQFLASFNKGQATAPSSGLVSQRLAYPGQTIPAGDPIAEIYNTQDTYIEWIIPARALRHPEKGAPVYVLHGNSLMRGQVEDVLPVSAFGESTGNIFDRVNIGQILTVRLNDRMDYPPIEAHVDVRYNYWRGMDMLVDLYIKAMVWTGIWIPA